MNDKSILICVFLIGAVTAVCFWQKAASQWHMIDVNSHGPQGDAHLLIDGNQTALIDVGRTVDTVRTVIPYLQRLGVNKLNHLFISHPHTDHYQGIGDLLDAGIVIDRIYHSQPPEGVSDFDYKPAEYAAMLDNALAFGTELVEVEQGLKVTLPNSEITVLFAAKEQFINRQRLSVNDFSVVMGWDIGKHRVLFTGDLDLQVGTLISQSNVLEAHVLKVPHHGVNGIAPIAFFDKVNPLISMLPQPNVLYRHTRGSQFSDWVDSNLSNEESSLLLACRNGRNGSVVLAFHANDITVTPEHPSQECPSRQVSITTHLVPFSQREMISLKSRSKKPDSKPVIAPILPLILSDDS